jgi:ATP-binding cassette subfamily F protein 3
MIVLQANNLAKSYGVENIFTNVSFTITNKDRVGLVGPNGVGKSTLLKCLVGVEEPDEGTIFKAKDVKIGYLPQSIRLEAEINRPLIDYVMDEFEDLLLLRQEIMALQQQMSEPEVYNNPQSLDRVMGLYSSLMEKYEREGGYSIESISKGILIGLGFAEVDISRSLLTFSGGQKTRLTLAKILLRNPQLLVLDEPTNYLDLASIEWLEGYIANYAGAILLVSHDRYFLDQVTNRTFALNKQGLESYLCGYSRYLVLKAEREDAQRKAYAKQQEYIHKQEEFIRKYQAGIKAKQARGRRSILNRLERVEKTEEQAKRAGIAFRASSDTGEQVIVVEDLSFGYPGRQLFAGLSFSFYRGEKVALIGDNGTGKTTLLKILAGDIEAKGKIKFGSRVQVAYFSQEHEDLNLNHTVMEEVWLYPHLTVEQVRSVLGRFLFTTDTVDKKVGSLSGGERSRLMLAKLFLMNANLLILDEPTNHLDSETREVLEAALADFEGNLLFVSHDRYFINRIATKVVELSAQKLVIYPGNFDYYKWKKAQLVKEEVECKRKKATQGNKCGKKPMGTVAPVQKVAIGAIEQEIERLEERLSELATRLGDEGLYSNPEDVVYCTTEYNETEEKLAELYAIWEEHAG